jgi:hypothetical protein
LRIAIDWQQRARETLILTGIALFLAFLRPFGTDTDTPLYIIFGFWLLLILAGALVGELSVWAFYRLWPEGPTWAMIAIVSLATRFRSAAARCTSSISMCWSSPSP